MKPLIPLFVLFFSLAANAQNSNIYQPPWKLIQQAAAQKQQLYDGVFQRANLLRNVVSQIKHLDGKDDVANVKEKQRYYFESLENITKYASNNPQNAASLHINIDNLQKELLTDFTTGDIFKIEASYFAREKFFEDFKSLRDSKPEKFLEMLKEGDYKYKTKHSGNSLDETWNAY